MNKVIQTLISYKDEYLQWEKANLFRLKNEFSFFNLTCLFGDNSQLGAVALYSGTQTEVLNYFYRAAYIGKIYAELYEKPIRCCFDRFDFAFLSNHKDVIGYYAKTKNYYLEEDVKSVGYQYIEGFQAILTKDDERLKHVLPIIYKAVTRVKSYKGVAEVYDGIYQRDKNLVIAGLKNILRYRKVRDTYSGLEELFCLMATTMYKLALYRDIPVDFKHPMIPQVLLSFEPLEHYEGYDFFAYYDQHGHLPPPPSKSPWWKRLWTRP